jgi:CBS domain-containing protein
MSEQQIQKKRIRHLVLEPAVCVQSGTSLRDAVDQMRLSHSSCILISKGEVCIGIFTERDYLNKVLSFQDIDRGRTIDEFMSPSPKILSPDDTVGQAIKIMNEFGFRNIPLIDDLGRCVGLLQIRNIIQFLAELYPEEVLNVSSRQETFRQPDGA